MGQWIRKLRQWTVFRSTDFITICFFASILSPFLSPHHSKLLRQSFFFCCGGKDWNASGLHRRKCRTCSYRIPPSVDKCFYVLFLFWVAVQSIDCFDIWGAPSLRNLDIFKFRKNMLRARSRNCLREMCDHFLCEVITITIWKHVMFDRMTNKLRFSRNSQLSVENPGN